MFRFHIFGIPVTVEPWFWLTLGFVGGGISASTKEAWLEVALFVMAGFVSILIHELGHALTIRKFGLPTQITLTAFGGYAAYPSGVLSRRQSFLVTAGGPAIQLVFAGLVWLLSSQVAEYPSYHIAYFITVLWGISLIWAVFNCLPIFPLDGGQMLSAVLGPARAKGLHLTGVVCAVLVGLLALSVGYLIVAIFMGLFAWQNYQMLRHLR